MNVRLPKSSLSPLLLAVLLGCPAGPNTDGPTVTLLPPSGTLGEVDSIGVTFSEPVDQTSLVLAGTLGSAASLTWVSDTQLSLSPSSQWALGSQTLEVLVKDPDGNAGQGSASLEVTETLLLSIGPVPSVTKDDPVTFNAGCTPGGCTLQCSLDAAALAACPDPLGYAGLAEGDHALRVVASWGAAKKERSVTWTIDRTAPSVTAVSLDGYGDLRLDFSEPIDAAVSEDVGLYTLTPGPKTITSATVTGSSLRLHFRPYQLPKDHALNIVTVQDAVGNVRSGLDLALTSSIPRSRVIFLSESRGDGNLKAWTTGGATGIATADLVCQGEAEAAGLVGSFRAFLSDDAHDAGCRMLGFGGKLANNCEQATLPTSTTGVWIGTDGDPLVEGYDRLVRGRFMRNVTRHADGSVAAGFDTVWHGTNVYSSPPSQGNAGANCSNWAGLPSVPAVASAIVTTRLPFQVSGTASCTAANLGLLCVQVDAGGFTSFGSHYKPPGKVAFVSSDRTSGALISGGLTGIAAADDLCQRRAAEAGLANPLNFVAWISDSTQDAYCRIHGRAQKGNSPASCGVSGTPPATGPWVTSNGFLWATDLTELTTTGPRVPIYANEHGRAQVVGAAESHNVSGWTGTTPAGQVSTWNASTAGATCADWSATAEGAVRGHLIDLLSWTQQSGQVSCNGTTSGPGALLCLER